MAMMTSAAGRAALMAREGCILHAYQDTVGVWTIGVGHTGRMSSPAVTPGMTITRDEADIFLANDLAPVEAAIAEAVKVATTQNQHDAMASLAFNIGAEGFRGSTVVHKLNANDPAGAADAFLMWEKPQELAKRRIGERAQFLTRDSSPSPIAVDDPTTKPVLAGIETAIDKAARPSAPIIPPVAGPHLLPPPAKPGFWASLASKLGW